MLALLRTRRWISFTLLVIVVIVAFGFLSRWQWSRAMAKQAEHNAEIVAMGTSPVTFAAATGQWQSVKAAGTFDAAHQVVVRQRPQDTMNGFWVLTPLTLDDSSVIWVNRGWMRAQGNATQTPVIPAPATGHVEVTGVLRMWESARTTSGLPAGMVSDADPAVLPVKGLATGYLQLLTPQQSGLEKVQLPDTDDSRNISYAIQWVLFAIVGIVGWFYFLWREANEDRRNAEKAALAAAENAMKGS